MTALPQSARVAVEAIFLERDVFEAEQECEELRALLWEALAFVADEDLRGRIGDQGRALESAGRASDGARVRPRGAWGRR